MLRAKTQETVLLTEAITDALTRINSYPPDAPEYKEALQALERLNDLRPKKPQPLSYDTLVVSAVNFLIAWRVINHERDHVVTTKLFSFLGKASR